MVEGDGRADWDGRGLPPAAAERIARAGASGVRSSLLSAAAATSLQSVGLDPGGEVMGCVVEHVGYNGYGGCGATLGYGMGFSGPPPAPVGTRQSRWAGFAPYADAIRRGYATALARLQLEAAGLGADGVVGISLSMSDLMGAREFLALGTAVRARSTVRPSRPFATDLPGSDVAKLMQGGWVPAALLVGFEVALRHDDWQTQTEASGWRGAEVSGYTELTQHVRHLVRTDVHQQLERLGADGFVASSIGMRVFHVEPSEHHRDHVAEALLTGTALAQFSRTRSTWRHRHEPPSPPRPTLTVLPLGGPAPRKRYR